MSNDRRPFVDPVAFAIFVPVGVVVVLLLWDYGVDEGWLTLAYWQEGDVTTSRSEVFRNLGLLAAAVIGLGFGVWRSFIALLNVRTAQQQAADSSEMRTLRFEPVASTLLAASPANRSNATTSQ